MKKTFVTSDVHGCRKTFQALLDHVGLTKEDRLVIAGDLIDRGPDSKGVIEDVLKVKESYDVVFLKGNHEDFLLKSYKDTAYFDSWVYPPNGGDKTLRNYGVEPYINNGYGTYRNIDYNKSIPDEHWTFLQNGLLTYEQDNFVIVHAGLDFFKNDPIKETLEDDKLWNRGWRYDGSKLNERYLIVGHTPTDSRTIFSYVSEKNSVIYIDNGCVFKNDLGFGNLCYFTLETFDVNFIKNCE